MPNIINHRLIRHWLEGKRFNVIGGKVPGIQLYLQVKVQPNVSQRSGGGASPGRSLVPAAPWPDRQDRQAQAARSR